MIQIPVIFWANQNGIHAICNDKSVQFGQIEIMNHFIAPAYQRDGSGIDAASYLPECIWNFLSSFVEKVSTLILDKSLPEQWHKIAWERLNWRGRKLGDLWHVVRLATIQKTTYTPSHLRNTLIWDQWENDRLSELNNVTIRFKIKQIEQDIQSGLDVGGYRRFIIFAHGGETQDCLFLDNKGLCWNPTIPKTLPPEVFIIACANHGSNFHDFILQCLQNGAKTVICGHGKLDELAMIEALSIFVNSDEPAYQTLWRLKSTVPQKRDGDVHWLRFYGDACISELDFAVFNAFQESKFDRVFKEFKELGLQSLLNHIRGSASVWQITKQILLSSALYLAEKEAHAEMNSLRNELKRISIHCPQLFMESQYSQANFLRRKGLYMLSSEELMAVLQHKDIFTNNPAQESKIFRCLLNILLDLNVVPAAQVVYNHIHSLLEIYDLPVEKFKLADPKARLEIRSGNVRSAIIIYKRKIHQTEDNRELANILYATSWLGDFEQAQVYAEHIESLLINKFNNGNDVNAYFLRALAAYHYLNDSKPPLNDELMLICEQKLEANQDKGPFAMTLLYHLLKTNDCDNELWNIAILALEDDLYWFELAAFHALAHQKVATKRVLNKFHENRRKVLEKIKNGYFMDNIDWLTICESIEQKEKTFLLEKITTTPTVLLKEGLLPL